MSRPEDIFAEGLMEKKAEEKIEPPVVASTSQTPAAPRAPTSRSVFSHPEAHPVALDMVLLKNFQLDWLSWLPDTLFSEIEKTFNTSIAEVNKLKILAAQTLHVTDAYWENWEVFEKTIWALNGVVPLITIMQPPDLPFLFTGVDIANSIREETYGDEVARYCAAVFLHENVFYAPAPMSFCQEFITQAYYICKDCSKKGSALPPFDGLCTSCAGHFDSEHPFKFEPDPDALKRGAGRNITVHASFDPSPVKARFEELNAMPADRVASAIKEEQDDIQAAKLITAEDYMKYRSQQLAEQLTSLRGWLEMS